MKAVPIYNDEEKKFLVGHCIYCPGCEQHHLLDSRWTFNGNFEQPTFTPSLLSKYRHPKGYTNNNPAPLDWQGEYIEEVCHSFITDGKIQFLGDCTHKLKNQTVELPENKWPDE